MIHKNVFMLAVCAAFMVFLPASTARAAINAQVAAAENLGDLVKNEPSSPWLPLVREQYKNGYERITQSSYYPYMILSDYVVKDGKVYFSPIDREKKTVVTPKLVSKNPKQFVVARGGVAHDGKSVFYGGKTVAKSKYFKELAFDRYAFANGLYQTKDHLDKKTPRYELQRVFNKVKLAKLKEVKELETKYRPVADGGYTVRWYRDGKYFYCMEGKGVVSQRLQEPVKINFLSSSVNPSSGSEDPQWLRVANTKERGYIQFSEERTGRKYDSRCNLI